MPSTRFQYLAAGVRYVNPDGTFTQPYRVYWQEFIDALDTALTDIESNVADLTDILTRLGLVEVLADGTFAIVDQGLEADGTVKEGKVVTASAAAGAFSSPDTEVGANITIPSSGVETVLHTSSVKTVGDATFGSYSVLIQGNWNNATDTDAGAAIYLETKENGGAWTRQADYTITMGASTSAGATTTYMPFTSTYSNSGAGLETVQVRLIGQAVSLGSGLKNSTVVKPRSAIMPGKR